MAESGPGQSELWDTFGAPERKSDEPSLVVDVDGFEGPLDLLLSLARSQKVDMTRISILALAEQYLAFIERIRELRLEVAADYLVMAAWLAYLKSRLLLPDARERRAERRGTGRRAGLPPAAARGHARRGGAARQPQPSRPRRFRPRRAGADRDRQEERVHGDPLRPPLGLRRAPAGTHDLDRPHQAARRSGRCRTRARR